MTFSEWLCDITERRFGGSVRTFAAAVGVSGTSLYSYIEGSSTPTESRLCEIVNYTRENLPEDVAQNYKERRSEAMKKGRGDKHSDTLCWSCQNAVPSKTRGCEWSRYFRPVEGWTVNRMYIGAYCGKDNTSYKVIECPEFMADDVITHADFNVDGLERLQERISEALSDNVQRVRIVREKPTGELTAEEIARRRAEKSERARVRYYTSRGLPVPEESEKEKEARVLYAAKRRRIYARKRAKKSKYNREIDRIERMMLDGEK